MSRSLSLDTQSSQEIIVPKIESEIIKSKLNEIIENLKKFSNLIINRFKTLPNFRSEAEYNQKTMILDYLLETSRKILENQVPDMPKFINSGVNFRSFTKENKVYDGFFNEEDSGYGFIQDDNKFYIGSVANGIYSGHGIMIYSPNDYYVGWWKDGVRSGYGVLRKPDGTCARGNFDNDKLNGYATIVYSQGDKYQGDFIESKRSGLGKYSYKKSDYSDYDEGEFYDGRIVGRAKLVRNGREHFKDIR
jgi:hypothetical protein